MDKIIIKGLKLYAYHGVNVEEKQDGQLFIIDLEADLPLAKPCQSDNVEDTVSYAKIIKTVRRFFTNEKYNLLEKAAQITADAVLEEYGQICRVSVTVKKPNAPIKAEFEYVAVEITRSRE